jgi:glycine C-acetyltransferase
MLDVDARIAQLKSKGLYGYYLNSIEEYLGENRVRVTGQGVMLLFGGYSYLGLFDHPGIQEAACKAIQRFGTGTQGVRMLAPLSLHRELEETLAALLRSEDAVTFSSGYSANVSSISSLVDDRDSVFCDKLNHASIIDGCLLSKAKLERYRHNDMDELETRLRASSGSRRKLVIVDSVFSMDGDIANLPALNELCQKYCAMLMVDEAHGLGVLGETGRGIEEHFGLHGCVDIRTGSFSKAIPSVGGYVVGNRKLCEYLRHHGRSFIYSAPVPPASAATALAALRVLVDEPMWLGQLRRNVRYFAEAIGDLGLALRNQQTPIFPIVCGSDENAWELAAFCRARGVYVQAIPYPVVPKNTARLRLAINALHTPDQMETVVSVLREGEHTLELPWKKRTTSVLCGTGAGL